MNTEDLRDARDNDQEVNEFNLLEFSLQLLQNWYWIAISVAITLCIAVFCMLRTTPTYTRSTSILIKNEDGKPSGSGVVSLSQDFQNLSGMLGTNTNIKNEMYTIGAPVVMQEVAKRLHLDVQMEVEQGLHDVPLYEESPIKLLLPQANDDDMFSFKMRLHANQTAELWDFENGGGKIDKRVTIKMGTFARTPVGVVVIQPTQYWHKHFFSDDITVNKIPLEVVGNMYNSRLNVSLSDKESTIVDISITDEDKQRAEDILCKLIDVYNEQWLKDRNRVAESTFEFITNRLNTLSKELGDVDQKISDYKSQNKMPDIDAASNMYMAQNSKNNDQILQLNNQLGVARYIREYLNDHSKHNQYLPTNTGIGSTGIETMIDNYNKAVSSRNDVLVNSSENSPLVQKFNNDLAQQRQTIVRSLDNLIVQLQSQVNSWQNTEALTNEKLAAAPQQVKQLLSVGRQQKVKEALYIYLLQKREENELSKTYTAWNTRIIQPPIGSKYPTSPRKHIVLLIALAIGVCVPAGIIFLMQTLNHTVRGRSDLEKLSIPLIGEIPHFLNGGKKLWKRHKDNAKRQVYVKKDCRDLINESFRVLRTKLDYFIKPFGADKKIILVTSFNIGAGKSFISANLSEALALKNSRVLAIDFDMRHASLSTFGETQAQGLSAYLCGIEDNVAKLIQHNPKGCNFDILPVGVLPPNPAELLLSPKMNDMLDKLRNEYDYIILDCPPIDIVTDTSIIKDYADANLFVIRVGLMDRRSLKDIEELYQKGVFKNMALVLNGTKYVSSRYGNFRYGYSYGYNSHGYSSYFDNKGSHK